MDFERLRREILLPLGEGRGALYRPYCCARGEMGEGVRLEPRPLTIVEGSYSQHPSMGVIYDLTVFLTCSDEIQRRRLQIREGEGFAAFGFSRRVSDSARKIADNNYDMMPHVLHLLQFPKHHGMA